MGVKNTKPVHTVIVRVKVFAGTKEEAEKVTTHLMRTGLASTFAYSTEAGEQIKHWQIKQ